MEVLVVVDMQNDFVTGVLGSDQAVLIVSNIVDTVKNFKGKIFFTQDTHYEDYLDTLEGNKLPLKHCIKGTYGWNIIDELKPYAVNVLLKNGFGCVGLIDEVSKIDNLTCITLVGLCSDICVISNALLLKSHFPNISIKVLSNCSAGVSVDSHNNAMKAMSMCHIDIVNGE